MRKKNLSIGFIIINLFIAAIGMAADTPQETARPDIRGCTHRLGEKKTWNIVGDAPAWREPLSKKGMTAGKRLVPQAPSTESIPIDLYIPAGGHLAIQFYHNDGTLRTIPPDWGGPFSAIVQAAIDKVPRWLQNDLIHLFSYLTESFQDKWAQVIVDAEDPYIDEIAFAIAHLSPMYLMSDYATPVLIRENARLIYEHDDMLDYVDVVDYGSSTADPDYYSTTVYRKVNFIDTVEVEVPRDIYYWYIVHPKITDEIPAYIDPEIVESNWSHSNNITTPDKGYFWRNFLFNYADPGYAKLSDLLAGCKAVWNEYSGGVNLGDDAMDILNRWQSRSMEFTSNEERPHQPVRIYRKHIGRCGENGDMRVAVARAALIPATSVASYSTDHVWNEFWCERWIHWDGTIDKPHMYLGPGWNKKFGSVFRWRGDGSLHSVTPRYTTEYATLQIFAVDSLDQPIDGARVILYTHGLDGTLWFDNYAVTDGEGKVTFLVGTDRSYYAKMRCDYGQVPTGDNNLMRVVGNSRPGGNYRVKMPVDARKPVSTCNALNDLTASDDRYFLEINTTVPDQVTRGRDLFDDMDVGAYQLIAQPDGGVRFFIADKQNYQQFIEKKSFYGYQVMNFSDSIAVGFPMDGTEDIFFVFDNSMSLHTVQHVKGIFTLYSTYDPDIPKVHVLQNYPNPLNPKKGVTIILYRLPEKTEVELTIYNLLGQKVKTLVKQMSYAGEFRAEWDGTDEQNHFVPAGLYLYQLKTSRGISIQKMMLVH